MTASPSVPGTRDATHTPPGIAAVESVQSARAAPSRKTCTSAGATPSSDDASTVNLTTYGDSAGTVMPPLSITTCVPKNPKPEAGVPVVSCAVIEIVIVPALGGSVTCV